MTKTLHVLSGLHVGAAIELLAGEWRLGGPDEGDAGNLIVLHDWRGAALSLQVGADGVCRAAGGDPSHPAAWPDSRPVQHGGIWLSVGTVGALAGTALAEPRSDAGASTAAMPRHGSSLRGRLTGACAVLGVILLGVASTLFASAEAPPASSEERPVNMRDLRLELRRLGLDEILVEQSKRGPALVGFVHDAQEDARGRNFVASLRGPRPRIAWVVASDVASEISAALQAPEVSTRYLGGGRFLASGRARSPDQLQAVATQLRADLGARVVALDLDVRPLRGGPLFASTMAADALLYQERVDGTKRFQVAPP